MWCSADDAPRPRALAATACGADCKRQMRQDVVRIRMPIVGVVELRQDLIGRVAQARSDGERPIDRAAKDGRQDQAVEHPLQRANHRQPQHDAETRDQRHQNRTPPPCACGCTSMGLSDRCRRSCCTAPDRATGQSPRRSARKIGRKISAPLTVPANVAADQREPNQRGGSLMKIMASAPNTNNATTATGDRMLAEIGQKIDDRTGQVGRHARQRHHGATSEIARPVRVAPVQDHERRCWCLGQRRERDQAAADQASDQRRARGVVVAREPAPRGPAHLRSHRAASAARRVDRAAHTR